MTKACVGVCGGGRHKRHSCGHMDKDKGDNKTTEHRKTELELLKSLKRVKTMLELRLNKRTVNISLTSVCARGRGRGSFVLLCFKIKPHKYKQHTNNVIFIISIVKQKNPLYKHPMFHVRHLLDIDMMDVRTLRVSDGLLPVGTRRFIIMYSTREEEEEEDEEEESRTEVSVPEVTRRVLKLPLFPSVCRRSDLGSSPSASGERRRRRSS